MRIKNKINLGKNMWIGLVDSSTFNSSQEDRIKAVTDIASITKGRLGLNDNCKHCQNGKTLTMFDNIRRCSYCGRYGNDISERRLNLYKRLKVESNGKPSRPFEFIPVVIEEYKLKHLTDKYNFNKPKFFNEIIRFSYFIEGNTKSFNRYLTNLRTLLNVGIKEEDILFNTPEEVEGFKVVIGKFPKTTFDCIVHYKRLSVIDENSENKEYLNKVEFYYPEYWNEKQQKGFNLHEKDTVRKLNILIDNGNIKPEEATKELSCRRLVSSAWCAWIQDENTWNNLFAEIDKEEGTQEITSKVIYNIKKLIY